LVTPTRPRLRCSQRAEQTTLINDDAYCLASNRVRFVSVYKTSNTQLVKEPSPHQRPTGAHVSPGTIAVLIQSEARELSTLPAVVKLGNAVPGAGLTPHRRLSVQNARAWPEGRTERSRQSERAASHLARKKPQLSSNRKRTLKIRVPGAACPPLQSSIDSRSTGSGKAQGQASCPCRKLLQQGTSRKGKWEPALAGR